MKQLILGASLIGLTCLSASAFSRNLPQGTIEVGGDSNFSLSSMETDVGNSSYDTDSTTLNIDGLYYVQTNLGVGLVWNYDTSDTDGFEATTNFIGPAVSYNISLDPKMSLKVGGAVGLASYEDDSNNDADGFGWELAGKLSYYLNNSVSVDGSVSYTSLSLEDDFNNEMDTTGFTLGVGLSAYF